MYKQTAFTPTENNHVADGIHRTPIAGLWYIAPSRFDDHRGFYAELSRVPEIDVLRDEPFDIKQLNLSHSEQNVIRGFHAEDWNKLITIVHGRAFCAWVDVRPDSETFGDVVTMDMGVTDDAVFGSMFISRGIANSFLVTEGELEYLYAVDELYSERNPDGDVALNVFDENLSVEWPLARKEMIISDRDKAAVSFDDFFKEELQ